MMFGSIYSQCLGDLNGDGTKNVLDIVLLVNDILAGDDVCEDFTDICVDIDGNIYQIIQMGDQLWMSENLKTTHYNNGSEIQYVQSESSEPDVWENLSTGAYGYYNNDPSHLETYGNLYNWYAVDEGDLCMEGWHVPSDDEWTVLTDYLGGSAGGKMKEEGLDHWNSPNEGATNESGFTALPAGYRNSNNGNYASMGDYGYFWSSSESVSGSAWYRRLNYYNSNVGRYGDGDKRFGFSIRCLRD